MRYLTVVPAISSTLDGPAYGCDDAEDARNPMSAVEDPDRLNYTGGSGTEICIVGGLIRICHIGNLPWDTEDPKNGRSGRGSKGTGDQSHM